MDYKHREADREAVLQALTAPNFLVKINSHVEGRPRILASMRYRLQDITLKSAWTSPAALELHSHVMADVARLPVLESVSALYFVADLTLGPGEVVFDNLACQGPPGDAWTPK